MDTNADLQAQIIALRTALEGAWLSMLHADPNGVINAERLRQENVAGLRALNASGAQAEAMRDAVVAHTDQLWKSIVWQLGGEPGDDASAG